MSSDERADPSHVAPASQGVAVVLGFFDHGRNGLARSIEGLTADPSAAIDRARDRLEAEVIPRLPYLDAPRHPMAPSLFYCAINLAVYQTLREDGVDAHAYGRAMLEHLATLPPPAQDDGPMRFDQPGTHPGEFRVEPVEGDYDNAFNITSCAICHLFSQFDAMALVPYMCASDDVISDKLGQGLARTGTIATGHDHCDFRYRAGAHPGRIADVHPELIHFERAERS